MRESLSITILIEQAIGLFGSGFVLRWLAAQIFSSCPVL